VAHATAGRIAAPNLTLSSASGWESRPISSWRWSFVSEGRADDFFNSAARVRSSSGPTTCECAVKVCCGSDSTVNVSISDDQQQDR